MTSSVTILLPITNIVVAIIIMYYISVENYTGVVAFSILLILSILLVETKPCCP